MVKAADLFIVFSNRTNPACPYYATENGFEIYNPFGEKPFPQVMLSFNSEAKAKEFIRDHCKRDVYARTRRATPDTQDQIESLNPDREEQLRKFIAAENQQESP